MINTSDTMEICTSGLEFFSKLSWDDHFLYCSWGQTSLFSSPWLRRKTKEGSHFHPTPLVPHSRHNQFKSTFCFQYLCMAYLKISHKFHHLLHCIYRPDINSHYNRSMSVPGRYQLAISFSILILKYAVFLFPAWLVFPATSLMIDFSDLYWRIFC